jgi:hypothetical protein
MMILLISTKTIGMAIKDNTTVFEFFFAYTNLFLKTINIVLTSRGCFDFSF